MWATMVESQFFISSGTMRMKWLITHMTEYFIALTPCALSANHV